jgi:ABC-type uncharacterized transport system ATPase subunit
VLLEAATVTKRFGGLVAVRDVSLAVAEGELVGLIGPNGAGETTHPLEAALAGRGDGRRARPDRGREPPGERPVHGRQPHA